MDTLPTTQTHPAAINRAHDLMQPFCLITWRSDGSMACITPYYIDRVSQLEEVYKGVKYVQ